MLVDAQRGAKFPFARIPIPTLYMDKGQSYRLHTINVSFGAINAFCEQDQVVGAEIFVIDFGCHGSI